MSFKIGDRVRLTSQNGIEAEYGPPVGATGVVVGIENDGKSIVMHFDDWFEGHHAGGAKRANAWYVSPNRIALIAPKKVVEPKRNTQNWLIIQHLSRGGSLTRITADHLYRIASLTSRIAQLRYAGYKIKGTKKTDMTGRVYVEYRLENNAGYKKAA